MAEQVDIFIAHGLIVTVDRERRIIKDGAIAVRGDRILEVGKTEDLRKKYEGKKVIDATHRVVLPGLIDSHFHVSNEGPKGYIPDDIPPWPWIFDWVVPINSAMTPEDEYLLSVAILTECVKTGTTTAFEAGTTKYPDQLAKAMEQIGIRGVVGKFAWDRFEEPAIMRSSTKEALDNAERVVEAHHGKANGRVNAWVSILGCGTQSDELLVGAKDLADRLGVGLNMHQSTGPEEVEEFVQEKGKRPIEHFAELGVLDKNVHLIHMVDVTDKEVDLVAKHDVKIVNCTATGLNLGYGLTPLGKFPEMIEKGVCVALGADGANCSNYFDMVRIMYLAAGIYKDARRDTSLIPGEKAIEMATVDGARAMLMEDEIGSLEKGKKADIILFDRRRPEWVPMLNVVSNLVYSADGKSVDTVIIDGNIVVEAGKLMTMDEFAIFDEMEKVDWEKKIKEKTGLPLKSRWPIL
ncbi:MAG: amidohydrolase family protein [Nitrospinota bacterium]